MRRPNILLVSPNDQLHQSIDIALGTGNNHQRGGGYNYDRAASLDEACIRSSFASLDIMLLDVSANEVEAFAFCDLVSKRHPGTAVLILSPGNASSYVAESGRHGAFDCIVTPVNRKALVSSLERALRYRELFPGDYQYQSAASAVREVSRPGWTEGVTGATQPACGVALAAIARVLEVRDGETAGHSDRVAAYSLKLGHLLGLKRASLVGLEQGALLHDIGKIGIPDSILLKPGPLDPQEQMRMREHVQIGLRIIEGIDCLTEARHVIGQHHERYAGNGYPRGLKGKAIHIDARIFAVADALDAMLSDRPYRKAQPFAVARTEIASQAGLHLDPAVVMAFLSIKPREWLKLREPVVMEKFRESTLGVRRKSEMGQ